MSNFFPNTLPEKTAQLASTLQKKSPSFLDNFYLSGGTALSLQINHRESEDLDFFNEKKFDTLKLESEISNIGSLSQTEISTGTLNTFVDSVKLQFLHYPYPLLEPTTQWHGIRVSSVLDIACTKLQTVSMRGSKKDFIDIYYLLDQYSLKELLEATQKKYNKSNYSQTHIIKSLVYFDDAQNQPMPRMIKKIDWEAVKKKLIEEVKNISFT